MKEGPMSAEGALPDVAVRRAIDHMNADHRDSLIEMAKALAGRDWATTADLTALDRDGLTIDVRGADRAETVRIPFDAPLAGAGELREAVVALALRAREELARR
jgi:putative heme iron utilization protein